MLNKCTFIGNVGNDPEIKSMQSGDKVANISLAVTDRWKDKATGERKERTEWVRVNVFNQSLIKVIEDYVHKGSKIYVEGQMQTRSYEKDGQKVYTTEIVMNAFGSQLILLDGKADAQPESKPAKASKAAPMDELESEIPFAKVPHIATPY